ncbi:YvcK family protein, partial [Patescibacteria group bacterium]|nr:YvcK family protein [Patescibacteria group bacterium]
FTYRFHQGGKNLKGMTFGNLFMAAMADIMGSQKKGIEETCRLLQVKGNIIPISYDDVRLVATYEDGSRVIGEHHIDEPSHDGKLKITNLETRPKTKLSEEARQTLLTADLIILGPGDFYTNTIANLIIDGMLKTLKKSRAKILFVSNLMTKYGETYNYTAKDFFRDLTKYLPLELIDYVLINNNSEFPKGVLPLYKKEHSIPVKDDLKPSDLNSHVKLIRADLLSRFAPHKAKGDRLKRSMIRHDPNRLTNAIMKLLKK